MERLLGAITVGLWQIFISIVYVKYEVSRPKKKLAIMTVFMSGTIIGMLFIYIFNGPYLLRYIR